MSNKFVNNMLSYGLIKSSDQSGQQATGQSLELHPFLQGALFRGAPLGAALYLVSRLLTGKKIKPRDLLLSSLGGGLLGGAVYQYLPEMTDQTQPKPDQGAKTEGAPGKSETKPKAEPQQSTSAPAAADTPVPSTTLANKPSQSVVSLPISSLSSSGGAHNVPYRLGNYPTAGDLPGYSVVGELSETSSQPVPSLAVRYSGWYGCMAQDGYHAAITQAYSLAVLNYAVQQGYIIEKDVDDIFSAAQKHANNALSSLYSQMAGIRNSQQQEGVNFQSIIESNLDGFRSEVSGLISARAAEAKNLNKNLDQQVYNQLTDFSKTLFYTNLVLQSKNLSPNNIRGDANTPVNQLNQPSTYVLTQHDLYFNNFIVPIFVDTEVGKIYHKFIETNIGKFGPQINDYFNNNRDALRNLVTSLPFARAVNDQSLFFEVEGNLTLNKSRKFGMPAYINSLDNSIDIRGAIPQKLVLWFMPRQVVHMHVDRLSRELGKFTTSDRFFEALREHGGSSISTLSAIGGAIMGIRGANKRLDAAAAAQGASAPGFLNRTGTRLAGAAGGAASGWALGTLGHALLPSVYLTDKRIVEEDVDQFSSKYNLGRMNAFGDGFSAGDVAFPKGLFNKPDEKKENNNQNKNENKNQNKNENQGQLQKNSSWNYGVSNKLLIKYADKHDDEYLLPGGYISDLVERSRKMGWIGEEKLRWI